MRNIIIWVLLTSIACVIIDGPGYWWMPFGVVFLLWLLDFIENMAKDSIQE